MKKARSMPLRVKKSAPLTDLLYVIINQPNVPIMPYGVGTLKVGFIDIIQKISHMSTKSFSV